ncbi:hypothetical protein CDR19_01860 [Ectopseudomonas toyotomiensis]|uniref:DUF3034 domain-containing protein n=1 Tax=Ectopseudomonas toyotomiensis TaxID=554344 RepID=A0A1I5MXB2_9GAMM|nr:MULTISPECIES: DUF3034 family protein [Pseudomonas]PIA74937.1 hypothetical protein CDR19_01860 [Pseudomonas toyotomiensis]SDA54214.1 Protein of unknown function [Pseudomonas sp. NFPP33]SFP14113.1 Protein of unknown function [Pseudomonas toyotomiensis]
MRLTYLLGLCLCGELAVAGEGRLLVTGGATSLEGAAGGGIMPWAVLAGYGERGEWGADVFVTRVETGDYRLDVAGVAAAYGNRIELSYARQRFDLGTLARDLRLPDNSLSQDVLGLKLRLAGDLIYDRLPQISLGLQHKRQRDFLVPSLVGAQRREDSDGYLAASRLILGGAFGYNLLLNANLRYSRANELGLLGFGGDRRDRHSWLKEGSVAVLLDRHWAVGIEYREKPDNLSFAGESDWADLFVGYFPSKNLAVVLAYARLGEIATLDNQDGVYLSVQGSF